MTEMKSYNPMPMNFLDTASKLISCFLFDGFTIDGVRKEKERLTAAINRFTLYLSIPKVITVEREKVCGDQEREDS